MNRRVIEQKEVATLLALKDAHPFISAAVDTVLAGVLIDQLQISALSEEHVDLYVKRQLVNAALHFLSVGWVPVTVTRAYLRDEKVVAFVIPHWSTYKANAFLNKDGLREYAADSTAGTKKVVIVESIRHGGFDPVTGATSTPMARLRASVSTLLEAEEESKQMRKTNAFPPHFVERVPPTQNAVDADLRARRTGEAMIDAANPAIYVPPEPNEAKCTPARTLDDVIDDQEHGRIIPAEDRLVFLPEHTRMSAHVVPPRTMPELALEREAFVQAVCATFHLPRARLLGAEANGIGRQQSTVASANDAARLVEGYEMVRLDLVHFCQVVVGLLLPDGADVGDVRIPIQALATPEQLSDFYHGGGLTHRDWRQLYAVAVGVPKEHVRPGDKTPRLPRRLDKRDEKPREVKRVQDVKP